MTTVIDRAQCYKYVTPLLLTAIMAKYSIHTYKLFVIIINCIIEFLWVFLKIMISTTSTCNQYVTYIHTVVVFVSATVRALFQYVSK